MPKSIVAEGKTTLEAISNGLKELNVSKEDVEVKIIEEREKRSFFSILAPRTVKVELTLKEELNKNKDKESKQRNLNITVDKEYFDKCIRNVEEFLKEFSKAFEGLEYSLKEDINSATLIVHLNGESSKTLIGYRGEVLNSLQTILNSIANKGLSQRIRVILNISDYRERREKVLEELAEKVSKTVSKTGKSITLEPMSAYERKIIHNRLQNNKYVKTHSIGEEPYRKIVISKN